MLFRSDRKSTRLNSSHTIISYAVFCLKKKKTSYDRPAPARHGPALRPPHRRRVRHVVAEGLRLDRVLDVLQFGDFVFFFFLNDRPPPDFHPLPPPALFPT